MRLAVGGDSASGLGPPSRLKERTVERRLAQRFPWLRVTPLGLPVDPDVRSTTAGSSSLAPGAVSRTESGIWRSMFSRLSTLGPPSAANGSPGVQIMADVAISAAVSRAARDG